MPADTQDAGGGLQLCARVGALLQTLPPEVLLHVHSLPDDCVTIYKSSVSIALLFCRCCVALVKAGNSGELDLMTVYIPKLQCASQKLRGSGHGLVASSLSSLADSIS